MLPHSYTVDSQSKAQDLTSIILSASSQPQISSACDSIISFLHHLTPDQSRSFFSLTFPTLIAKIFGFDDSTSSSASSSPSISRSSNGWIAITDSDVVSKLLTIFSPSSVLFSLILAVDRINLVRYVFPIERLPEWTRLMLSNPNDFRVLSDLCPLFKNKVKGDPIKGSSYPVQLNVFEYYLFWFAYYPVCRGMSSYSENGSIRKSKVFRLENWASSIKGFSSNTKRSLTKKIECNMYVSLLYAYLKEFVSGNDLNAHQPYRSSLLHYQSDYDGSVLMRAEFVVNTLVQFWFVDNDFSPVPVVVAKSFGVSFPFLSVLGETMPVSGLGEVMKLFVKYLNLSSVEILKGFNQVEYIESPRRKSSVSGSFDAAKSTPYMGSIGSWNSLIQRPLYRFILRTFLFCPVETSMKNVADIFSLWICFMEPWKIGDDNFVELDADKSAENEKKIDTKPTGLQYVSSWQGYVLSNYLFYSSLVMHFIGFAHKFLHSDAEVIVEMVAKAINILTSSRELTELIKNVDIVFHSKQAGSAKTTLHSLYRYVPSIREQLQDWENGLCESDADGSFLQENWNKDLRLFSDGEDGGQQLLQLFILRAESELQATTGDNLANKLQYVDSLKSQIAVLFGCHTVVIKRMQLTPDVKQSPLSRDEMFKPKRIGNSNSLTNIKYKGDWMKRPISDDEIAWLAKLLVQLSDWLNKRFILNQETGSSHADPICSYVDVSSNGDDAKPVIHSIYSWFVMLCLAMLGKMRQYGVKVNLRVLASKKVVMVLLLYGVFHLITKAYALLLKSM